MTGTRFGPAAGALSGELTVPGDKSISHRAVLMGAVSEGPVRVEGFLPSADTLASVAAVRSLGVSIDQETPERLVVHGAGWEGLREPDDVIDVHNAGTLIRLLPGLVASREMVVVLTGDASIRRRPMARVLEPLRAMGAAAWGRACDRLPPVVVRGGPLRGIEHRMEIASAQVKSCVLLAGLRASGETTVLEPGPTRDHTERLIRLAGGLVEREGDPRGAGAVRVAPVDGPLHLSRLRVPGDLSSAAFLLVAALLVPGSRIAVHAVGLNPTRSGILDVLSGMGARLDVVAHGGAPARQARGVGVGAAVDGPGGEGDAGEPIGTITVEASDLRAIDVGGADVALMIDEVPIWALAAARAEGVSRLRDARELRVKESDRLSALADVLRALDVRVREYEDGLDIEGRPDGWRAGVVRSRGDHRLAMVGAVAGLASREGVIVDDTRCIAVSFPAFAETVRRLTGGTEQ